MPFHDRIDLATKGSAIGDSPHGQVQRCISDRGGEVLLQRDSRDDFVNIDPLFEQLIHQYALDDTSAKEDSSPDPVMAPIGEPE